MIRFIYQSDLRDVIRTNLYSKMELHATIDNSFKPIYYFRKKPHLSRSEPRLQNLNTGYRKKNIRKKKKWIKTPYIERCCGTGSLFVMGKVKQKTSRFKQCLCG